MFTCDKCGLCCMHIDESSLDEGMNRGDGVCKFFNDNTYLCKIKQNEILATFWFDDIIDCDKYILFVMTTAGMAVDSGR